MANNNFDEGKNKALGTFIVILIVITALSIMAFLIKSDVGGFGSEILRPVFKNIPVINFILPEATNEEIAKETDTPYNTLESALSKVEELENSIVVKDTELKDVQEKNTELTAEVARLKEFETERTEFLEEKNKFFDEIVYGEEAPATDIYIEWYEALDQEAAARIYEEVIKSKETDNEITELANTYANMDAKKAASILEKMSTDLDTVALILSSMAVDKRGAILGEMDPEFAANVTKKLLP